MICKIIKLSTGDIIIGNITEESRSYIDIHRPIRIILAPKGPSSMGVMMVKWDPISDFEIPSRIMKHGIIAVSEPDDDFKKSYIDFYEKHEQGDMKQQTDDFEPNLEKIEELMTKLGITPNTSYTLH